MVYKSFYYEAKKEMFGLHCNRFTWLLLAESKHETYFIQWRFLKTSVPLAPALSWVLALQQTSEEKERPQMYDWNSDDSSVFLKNRKNFNYKCLE